ncbi:MAG: hypothetical protein ACI4L9_03610 [Candidatus Coproplasma sp.]
MKIFKYRFTKLIYALIGAGIALCAVGFGVNLYVCITQGISTAVNPAYPIIQYCVMFFISAALAVILISLLISSYYSVDKTYLKTSFGIIKSKYAIADIETVELNRKTNKLSVFFNNGNYIVIVVKEEWYTDFVQSILDANPKIEYSIVSKDSTDPDQK